jgi:predicted Ser/Thr protein kinase
VNERWSRIGELFDRLVSLPAADRDLQLQTASEPEEIKSQVRSLLDAHDRAEGFLEPIGALPSSRAEPQNADIEELPAGTVIGPYRIARVVGRGGMGVVYEAEDTRLYRRVALKALPSAFGQDEVQRRRLRQEARAAGALQHAGIATIYALEEIDGGLFISSEYLEGRTLRDEFRDGPQPADAVIATATDIARALCTAHERGIVHRDLKPENIVRTTAGVVKILDFGLAQFEEAAHDLSSRTRLTQQGLVVGTPAYMAPEQLLGQPTDFRVDHFALGVLIYEACTGRHPFGAESLPSTIAKILAAPPAPPPSIAPLPPALWDIVDRCLQKNPGDRFSSTRELIAELERAAAPALAPAGAAVGKVTVAPGGASAGTLTPAGGGAAVRTPLASAPVASVAHSSALKWWRFHQFAAALAYWAMVWPVWIVHRSVGRAGLFFFLAVLAAVVIAGNLRLHLWFSSRVYPEDLASHRRDVAWWIRGADIAFAALLIVGGIALPAERIGWAAVLISYGIGSAIAFAFIEPATARAAFRENAS